jgi:hypothetical protein
MAITNQERVGKTMELLRTGLAPFVEREFKNHHQEPAHEGAQVQTPTQPELFSDSLG